jgi:hypothetical protein
MEGRVGSTVALEINETNKTKTKDRVKRPETG